jgi:hypothetical protein
MVTNQMIQARMQEEIDDLRAALSTLPPSPADGWRLVPVEPTQEMIDASLEALTVWRKGLSHDEAILRRSEPIQSGRVWLASATPEEKAAIRYRAMIAAAPPSEGDGSGEP